MYLLLKSAYEDPKSDWLRQLGRVHQSLPQISSKEFTISLNDFAID